MHSRLLPLSCAAAVTLLALVTSGSATRDRRQARCSAGAPCIPIDSCPRVRALFLSPNAGDKQRAQQLVCGREGRRLKVCCASSNVTPTPTTITVTPTSNPGGNGQLLPSTCGQANDLDKIFGGTNTVIGEFPWMAALGYIGDNGSLGWNCGGALINDRYVLTAAHCGHPDFLSGFTLTTVRLGEHDFSKTQDCNSAATKCLPPVQDFAPEQVIIHPSFNKRASESDDIALIRLNRKVQFNAAVQPICLPPAGLNLGSFLAGRDPVVIGWGITQNTMNVQVLQKVAVPFVDFGTCKRANAPETLVSGQICFGGRAGQDSCRGDSGGPLFLDASPGTILGIVSKGGPCGKAGVPAIYTDVPFYRGWIVQNLRP
ncbi:phenoloxidase-activating factor 3-like [Penaeus chinensis]|uniref:phenoloxidase-activating factor 3-like n=1 Tax=Penaeus chinensis TaxID=139456 RepID=UPI001FB77FC4|nr:phenoloxidase-activating factor 3-like [Penaeus chinensis]XP_047487476.1 phenoloxidase-activating factor 3-like [Penaeus chinensis]